MPGRGWVGIRASELGFALRTRTLCTLCRRGWKSSQKQFLLETEQGSSYWRGQEVAPLHQSLLTDCWGPFSFDLRVEKVEGSLKRRKEGLLECEEGHPASVGGALAATWSLPQEPRIILGAWRGSVGVCLGSDYIRPRWQSDCLCVCPNVFVVTNPLCFYPSRNVAEQPNYQEWSSADRIRPILICVGSFRS